MRKQTIHAAVAAIFLAVATLPSFAVDSIAKAELTKKLAEEKDRQDQLKEQDKAREHAQVAPAAPLPLPPVPDDFQMTKKSLFPMTSEEIIELRKKLDETQRASSTEPVIPAKPVTGSLKLSSDPGATPPVIRLASGFVTTITFVDSSGAPWPVVEAKGGNGKKFQVEQFQDEDSSNVITLSPLANYIHSNLAVKLKGRSAPALITVVSGQVEVDYRTEMILDSRGPKAAAPVTSGDYASGGVNPTMQQILDGMPPSKAKELNVVGGNARAYSYNGKIYLRTKLSLMSPAWTRHNASADGMHVYEIPMVPVVLASLDGKETELTIEGIQWQASTK